VLTSLLFLSRPNDSLASPCLWNSHRSGASANLGTVNAVARQPLWILRGTWVLLALLAVGPLDELSASYSTPVAAMVVALVGLGWTAAMVALLVPRAAGLTAVRLLVPAVSAAAGAVALGGLDPSVRAWAAAAVAIVCSTLALSPAVADGMVDGSSYGPERRIPLRTPVALVALACLTWVLTVAAAVSGPLLMAAGNLVAGALTALVGAGITVVGVRSLHQLSRRWLVLVPTGLVLHDPLTMPEPQLFLRQTMERLGPAHDIESDPTPATGLGVPSQDVTEDLTAGASGLVIELRLGEPVELLVHTSGRSSTLRSVRAVRFTPSRPAELLREAAQRRLPVG
jgi:hypothetical protein